MSFSNQSGLTVAQKIGCVLYAVISGLTVAFMMGNAVLGDCAYHDDGCLSQSGRAFMFYGAPLLALVGGALLLLRMTRDSD